MSKRKLEKFSELKGFESVIEPLKSDVADKNYYLKGRWSELIFKNSNPLVLELGCGRGDYSIGLSTIYPDKNFVAVDIKGCRIWNGAKYVEENNIKNIRYLRTRLEFITSFFGEDEVSEIWLPFPDPRLKNSETSQRTTSPIFLNRYGSFLKEGGYINLKTDSAELFSYTSNVLKANNIEPVVCLDDLYNTESDLLWEIVSIQTKYERKFLTEGKKIKFLRFVLEKGKDLVNPYI